MSTIKKAIAAAITACGTGLGTIAASPGPVDAKQILVVVSGTLVAFGVTYGVSNS